MSSIFLTTHLDKYVEAGSSLGSRGAERLTLSCPLHRCWKACMLYGNSGILVQSGCSGFGGTKDSISIQSSGLISLLSKVMYMPSYRSRSPKSTLALM